jgi:hypothetical protein
MMRAMQIVFSGPLTPFQYKGDKPVSGFTVSA